MDIELAEWQSAGPSSHPALAGLRLSDGGPDRRLVDQLTQHGALRVLELASGLGIETTSHVGTVAIGPIRLRIRPKIDGTALVALMRYAYGFRRLKVYREHLGGIDALGLHDVLILQMAAEASELIARGLHRNYVRHDEALTSPVGRIGFSNLARQPAALSAGLPCSFHRRTEDCPQNQALLAGLRFAGRLASHPELRSRLIRLARLMDDRVSTERLSVDAFRRLAAADNRLVAAYRPFMRLLELLFRGNAATVLDAGHSAELPGFMLDMNLFFQDLVARFLTDNLQGYALHEQWRLQGMFAYQNEFNPNRRRMPQPRPDFILTKAGRVAALLDAKYRDLWTTDLPRDILYQLTIYALSQQRPRTAVILYPTTDPKALEARIAIREPLAGLEQGTVVLRPVHVGRLVEFVISSETAAIIRERESYAWGLAFGLN